MLLLKHLHDFVVDRILHIRFVQQVEYDLVEILKLMMIWIFLNTIV